MKKKKMKVNFLHT